MCRSQTLKTKQEVSPTIEVKIFIHVLQGSDLSVATISRLLEQMEGGSGAGGLVAVPTLIFFTESDKNKRYIADSRSMENDL